MSFIYVHPDYYDHEEHLAYWSLLSCSNKIDPSCHSFAHFRMLKKYIPREVLIRTPGQVTYQTMFCWHTKEAVLVIETLKLSRIWVWNYYYRNSIESVKTTSTSMENVSTGVLDKTKENYLRCKDRAKKSYDVLRHIQWHISKYMIPTPLHQCLDTGTVYVWTSVCWMANQLTKAGWHMWQRIGKSSAQVMACCILSNMPLLGQMMTDCKMDPQQQVLWKFEPKY